VFSGNYLLCYLTNNQYIKKLNKTTIYSYILLECQQQQTELNIDSIS